MKPTILIVDDQVEIRRMLSRHFRFQGYEVETAGDGKEALSLLSSARYDIMITDIRMPVMDGIELLGAVRSQYPMLRTIIITGYVSLENVLACMRHGADTFILKPLEDLGELDSAVSRAFDTIKHWLRVLEQLRGMKPKQGASPE